MGKTDAVREIREAIEGKAVARHAGADGGPLEINIAERVAQLRAARANSPAKQRWP